MRRYQKGATRPLGKDVLSVAEEAHGTQEMFMCHRMTSMKINYTYGKPFYYLFWNVDILFKISDILYII